MAIDWELKLREAKPRVYASASGWVVSRVETSHQGGIRWTLKGYGTWAEAMVFALEEHKRLALIYGDYETLLARGLLPKIDARESIEGKE